MELFSHPWHGFGLEILEFLQVRGLVGRVFLNQSTCLMMDLRMVTTLPREDVVEIETPSSPRGEGAGSNLRELVI